LSIPTFESEQELHPRRWFVGSVWFRESLSDEGGAGVGEGAGGHGGDCLLV